MKKSNNPELQRLLWLIDFINLDIDRLPKGDFLKILVEMDENLRPGIDNPGLWTGRIKKLLERSRQANLKNPASDLFDSLYERLNEVFDYPTLQMFAKKTQQRVKGVFDKIYESKDYVGPDIERYPYKYKPVLKFKERLLVTVGHGQIEVGPDEFGGGLEYEVAELIYRCSPPVDLPYGRFHDLSNLKRCQAPLGRATGGKIPRCGKYFWQVYSKMEKHYCSTQCAWRAAAWQRRQEEKARANAKGDKTRTKGKPEQASDKEIQV